MLRRDLAKVLIVDDFNRVALGAADLNGEVHMSIPMLIHLNDLPRDMSPLAELVFGRPHPMLNLRIVLRQIVSITLARRNFPRERERGSNGYEPDYSQEP